NVAVAVGSTPTITTRGGNALRQGGAAGTGGAITIASRDSTAAASGAGNVDEAGLTIGAATTVNANADLAAAVTADQSGDTAQFATGALYRAALAAGDVTMAQTQASVIVGGTIDITDADDTTWTFNGNHP